jgi:hypothetical protein
MAKTESNRSPKDDGKEDGKEVEDKQSAFITCAAYTDRYKAN